MGGALGIALSFVSVWVWWPQGGFLLAAAVALGIVHWWCFGVMHNSIRSINAISDYVAWIDMVSCFVQVGLLIWGVIQSDAIMWWQALVAVVGLSVVLMFLADFIVFFPLLVLVPLLIRACG